MRITVYTTPNCSACKDALNILGRYVSQYGLEINEIVVRTETPGDAIGRDDFPVIEIEGSAYGKLIPPIDESLLHVRLEMAWRAEVQPTDVWRAGVPGVGAAGSREMFESRLDRLARYIGQHWLKLTMSVLAIFVGLPWLAPVFAALGWWGLADPIYTVYAVT